jgi:hypothetical protein
MRFVTGLICAGGTFHVESALMDLLGAINAQICKLARPLLPLLVKAYN